MVVLKFQKINQVWNFPICRLKSFVLQGLLGLNHSHRQWRQVAIFYFLLKLSVFVNAWRTWKSKLWARLRKGLATFKKRRKTNLCFISRNPWLFYLHQLWKKCFVASIDCIYHKSCINWIKVEAIETLFIPLVIHNNKDGKDKEILDKYNEPAWNNPVVRFVDSDGNDIIKREDGLYQSLQILLRMKEVLKKVNKPVPAYMENLINELNNSDYQSATFTMACYWEGEKQLGKIKGVTKTTPGNEFHILHSWEGWSGSKEVVQVIYNPSEVSERDLSSISGFEKVANDSALRAVSDSECKYYLKHHLVYKYVPLTPMQAAKVNSAISGQKEEEIAEWLSPRQQVLVSRIQKANLKNFGGCNHDMGKLAEYEDSLAKVL